MEHVAALQQTATLTLSAPELALIPVFPLAAFTILIFWGRRIGRFSPWLAVAALAASCAMTFSLMGAVLQHTRLTVSWAWLSQVDTRWALGLSVDGLSWVMLVVVTTIAPMIAIYSAGYMHEDPRFSRFFAYFSLFCASMLGLVMADHFVLLYACWELVGLCSYLLISFWFEKPSAVAAGRKAFLTTRVGDAGLLIGILLLAWQGGALHFNQLNEMRAHLSPGLLTWISTLIFLGAVGKSAQIPLHVWLPDAMEDPTPVSALIHAATMVAAGVYLVARTFPLFTAESLQIVCIIGLATHLLAGTVALTMTDIKRILAYSTVSQLGLMMTALGLGAMPAAMFHLYTHAFFKALLFLTAGSVIHATHQQELSQLGGLAHQMPWTRWAFLIAALSMGGFPFLSGFWSKDAILLAAQHRAPWLMGVLLLGAVMTSAYIFRLYLRCFHGPMHASHDHHAHESPWIMVGPMVALAVGAALAGLAGSPMAHQQFFSLLGDHAAHEGIDVPVLIWSSMALALGVWLAFVVGVQRRNLLPVGWRPLGQRLYTLAANKYYVDEGYDRFIIQPFIRMTTRLARWDQRVVDGAVNAVGRFGWWVGQTKAFVDRVVVDGIVNGLAVVVRGVGAATRRLQTGIIHHYLFVVIISVVVLAALVRR